MEIYIGIDPSLNSTGLCLQFYEDDQFVKDLYYIIKPNKLTKKEKAAQDKLINFDYALYEKMDLDIYKDNNLFSEYWKTVNMINIVKTIKHCIYDNVQGRNNVKLYIVQEGISYGSSIRTKSIFDLAGLNYMIRNEFIEKENILFFIASSGLPSINGTCLCAAAWNTKYGRYCFLLRHLLILKSLQLE